MKLEYITLGLAALLLATSCRNKEKSEDTSEAMPVEVSLVAVDSVTLYKDYPGKLIADRTARAVAKVNGILSAPLYDGGEYVKEGQLLFTIDNSEYTNALNSALANLSKAKSDNAYAEQHYEAVNKAYSKNAVSQMELSQALNARDQSRAAITSAEAALADARKKVNDCSVRAPLSGHVTTNQLSKGNYVMGESSPVVLATVYKDDVVVATFTIEDASFLRMLENTNNRDKINYNAIPINFSEKLPHDYTGALNYMAPNVNATTGTIELQAKVDNTYNELKPGMYCTIRLPYKLDPQAMIINDASISTDQLGKYVYVVNDSNKVVYTPIKVGDLVQGDTMRVVTEGLKPTDRYVTSAILKVRNGMTVKPFTTDNKK
ncbi:MAG: efflux RND transporter periplasmic adaptor subunit [Muribaculaceae bacterium]